MSTREYERLTNRFCKRGVRIRIHRSEFYILQQVEPYDVQTSEICCMECEMEAEDA